MEDIAAEVGVSPRTFNNYFSSKGEAIAARHLERARSIAAELRARPASKPLWEAITDAALARFALGQEGDARHSHDQQWIAGLRLMIAEPALQGEMVKAGAMAEAEFAAAVAERTGTDVTARHVSEAGGGRGDGGLRRGRAALAARRPARLDQDPPDRRPCTRLAAGLPTLTPPTETSGAPDPRAMP